MRQASRLFILDSDLQKEALRCADVIGVGSIWVFVSVICYSFALCMTKILFNQHSQKYQILFLCAAVQTVLVALCGFFYSLIPNSRNVKAELTLAVLGATAFIIYQLGLYNLSNIGYMSTVQSLLVFYSSAFAFCYLKAVPPRMGLWFGSALTTVGGIYIVLRPHESGFSKSDLIGVIFCLCALVFHSWYVVLLTAWKPNPLEVVFAQRALLATVLLPWSLLAETWFQPTVWECFIIFLMGCGFAGGLGCQIIGFRKSNVAVASVIWNTKLGWDFIFQLIFLNITIDGLQACGIVIIFASVSFYKIVTSKSKADEVEVDEEKFPEIDLQRKSSSDAKDSDLPATTI